MLYQKPIFYFLERWWEVELKICQNTYIEATFMFSEGPTGMIGQYSNSQVNISILPYENDIFATLAAKQASNNLP